MAIYVNNRELDMAYRNGSELDQIYANNNLVWESTRYIARPTVSANLTYNGNAQSPTISPASSDGWYILPGSVTSATSGGTYTITFRLRSGYAWSDETTDDYVQTWTIKRMPIAIPSLSGTSKTFNAATQAPTISGYNATYMTQSGTASASAAGSYAITWTLKSTVNTQWTDGTTAAKSANWSIAKRSLTIPSLSGTTSFAFIEGTTRSVTVSGYDSTYMTQSGSTSTDALGTHTVTWALRYPNSTTWSDGTTSNKSKSWYITWVNGTSHYRNDLYNKGWYGNGLEFQYGVTWDSDCISINNPGGGTSINTLASYSGTFHAIVYKASGDVRLVEVAASSFSPRTIATITAPNWQEVSGTHITSDFPRFGISAGSSYKVQRIWVT